MEDNSDSEFPAVFAPIIKLWILRVLVRLNRLHALLDDSFLQENEALKFLNLGLFDDESPGSRQRAKADALKALLAVEADAAVKLPEESDLVVNARWCQLELGLSEVDIQILVLMVLERQSTLLSSVFSSLGQTSSDRLFTVISTALGVPLAKVRYAFDQESPLVASGLLSLDERGPFGFRDKVELLQGLAARLTVKHSSLLELYQGIVAQAGAPTFTIQQ